MSDLRDELRAYHFATRVQTGTKTHGGENEYADFCVKCHTRFPCLVLQAVNEADESVASHLRIIQTAGDNYDTLQRAYDQTLELLAAEQGRLRACEEIIARVRAGCDPDVVGYTIQTRRVLDMLGSEPKP